MAAAPTGAPVASAEPDAPAPSPEVQKVLDELNGFAGRNQPREGLEAADRALALARQKGDAAGEALAWEGRGWALERLGRLEEAAATLHEEEAAWARAGDGPGRIAALATEAMIRAEQSRQRGEAAAGNRSEATQGGALLVRAIGLARGETRRPLGAAQVLRGAGELAYRRGLLAQARSLWGESLALYQRLQPRSLEVVSLLDNLGVTLWQMGDVAGARETIRRAAALAEKLAPDSPDVAATLGHLGTLARAQGDLEEADRDLRRALAIKERMAPLSLDTAVTLNNLGGVSRQRGDWVAARHYFGQALGLFQKLAPGSLQAAKALDNLGTVSQDEGDFGTALEYHRRALALFETMDPESADTARCLNNLGEVAHQLGDLPAAQRHFLRALSIGEKRMPDSLDVAMLLDNLGGLAYTRNDLGTAEAYHRRALGLYERLAPGSLDLATSLNNLAVVAGSRGDWSRAELLSRRAWEVVRRQGAAVAGDEARQAFGAATAIYAAQLARAQIALGRGAAAFTTLEEGRAQALQQLLIERHLGTSGAPARLRAAYEAAVAERDQAEQAASQASRIEAAARRRLAAAGEAAAGGPVRGAPPVTGGAPPAAGGPPVDGERAAGARAMLETAARQLGQAQSSYTRARIRSEQLWAEIRRGSPRAYARPVGMDRARRQLPAGTLFVAFMVARDQTALFLLPHAAGRAAGGGRAEPALRVYAVPVSMEELGKLVQALRAAVTDPETPGAESAAAGRALFSRLFPPEARKAIERAPRLLISPDGPLWEAPFAALVMNAAGPPRFLGSEKAIAYTQSLTLFAQSRGDAPRLAAGRRPVVVAVGDPRFAPGKADASPSRERSGERGLLWSGETPPAPLPATRAEAATVARLYGGELLTGAAATEAALRKRLRTADVLHLATHGYLHPARPMSSGVLLAPPAKEPAAPATSDDGALQAWEIYSQLKLRAELVVLSACETGRGQNVPGEGIVGLTRALQYAGARSIVASQWKVADRSTATLMLAFHAALRGGAAKDEALRRAIRRVRQNPRTAHPYYWAPFILIGDPDNPTLGVRSGARHRGSSRPLH